MRIIDPVYMVIIDSQIAGVDNGLTEQQIVEAEKRQAEFDLLDKKDKKKLEIKR